MAHVREFVLVPLHVITILPWPLRIGPFSICFVSDTSFFPVKSRCLGSHKPTVSLKKRSPDQSGVYESLVGYHFLTHK